MHYLTSLRGIAACIVMVYHIGFYFKEISTHPILQWVFAHGYLGVDFFFILSGFILTLNYKNIFEKRIKITDLKSFFIKRIARIYPLHLFILLCFLIIPLAHFLTDRSISQSLYGLDAFLAKLLLLDVWFNGYPYWKSWNTPSWTISGEAFAYLSFPFICLSLKFSKYLPLLFFTLSLVIISCAYSYTGSSSIGDNISELGLLRCFFEFVCGVCVCEFHHKLNKIKNIKWELFFVTVTLSFVATTYIVKNNYVYIPFFFSLLLLTIINFRWHIHTFLEKKFLVVLGDISYSIYLSHTLILYIYVMLFVSGTDKFGYFDAINYICLTVVFSFLTYKYIEVPMRKKITSRYC